MYWKPTNTGLLLHFASHTNKRYKKGLLKTMIHRAHALASTTEAFEQECTRLRSILVGLDYLIGLIVSTIQKVVRNFLNGDLRNRDTSDERNAIRICLPSKDQTGANAVKKQMTDLSRKVGINLKPVFTSRKLEEHLRQKEVKPSIVNKQCVVYLFQFVPRH